MNELTPEQREQLKQLAAKPDEEIDFSDIPEIREIPPDAFIGRFYNPDQHTA